VLTLTPKQAVRDVVLAKTTWSDSLAFELGAFAT
jgi:hypothetical protein